MPPKKGKKQASGRKAAPKTKRRRAPGMHGGSKFTDFFKGVYTKVLKPVGNFVKDNKLISRGLSIVPNPGAKIAGTAAGMLGLGHPQVVYVVPQKMAGSGSGHVRGTHIVRA